MKTKSINRKTAPHYGYQPITYGYYIVGRTVVITFISMIAALMILSIISILVMTLTLPDDRL